MNYDLNIENYTKKDLINFLNLPEIYEENMLLQKKNEFIKNVYNTDDKNKMIIINFINDAVDKLKSFTLINNTTMLTDIKTQKVENFDITNISKNDNSNHPVVDKPYTKFMYSNPSIAFDGILNPLERRVVTKILSIDSLYRENFCSTNPNSFIV